MQFFHPDGERGSSRNRRELKAKELCAACPVRAECAAQALRSHEPYGVWGGFTEAERLRLLAVGWKDTADRYGRRVDIAKLEARLGPAMAGPPRTVPAHPAATGHGAAVRSGHAAVPARPVGRAARNEPARPLQRIS
jgi:WhiB family transcriptional regulator, redox-sensing transcriptional regulator